MINTIRALLVVCINHIINLMADLTMVPIPTRVKFQIILKLYEFLIDGPHERISLPPLRGSIKSL